MCGIGFFHGKINYNLLSCSTVMDTFVHDCHPALTVQEKHQCDHLSVTANCKGLLIAAGGTMPHAVFLACRGHHEKPDFTHAPHGCIHVRVARAVR